MQEWIGHIAAIVIGGTILLILAVVGWRGQHNSVSATQFSAAKEGILDFAEVIEEDVSNMGAGRTNNTLTNPAGYGAFVDASAYDPTGTPASIRFYSWTARDGTYLNPQVDYSNVVEYRWQVTDSVQVQDPATHTFQTVPSYRIERFVNGTANGESIDTLTEVAFVLYDASGAELTPAAIASTPSLLNQVRAVAVTLRGVSPLGGGEGYRSDTDAALRYEMDQSRWSRFIRPPNLARVPN